MRPFVGTTTILAGCMIVKPIRAHVTFFSIKIRFARTLAWFTKNNEALLRGHDYLVLRKIIKFTLVIWISPFN